MKKITEGYLVPRAGEGACVDSTSEIEHLSTGGSHGIKWPLQLTPLTWSTRKLSAAKGFTSIFYFKDNSGGRPWRQ